MNSSRCGEGLVVGPMSWTSADARHSDENTFTRSAGEYADTCFGLFEALEQIFECSVDLIETKLLSLNREVEILLEE